MASDEQPASPEVQPAIHDIEQAVSTEVDAKGSVDLNPPDLSWLRELQTSNRRNDLSLSDKVYYSLAEASEQLKCTPNDLLHYGSRGEIAFIISIPAEIDVYSANSLSALTVSPMFRSPLMTFPEMLVLLPSDCRQIECNGGTAQGDFKSALVFDKRGNPQTVLPNTGAPIFFTGGWVWRAYHQGQPVNIEIGSERLFLLRTELVRIVEPAVQSANEESPQPKKRKTKRPENNASDCSAPQQAPTNLDAGNDDLNAEHYKEKAIQPESGTAKQPNTAAVNTPPEPYTKSDAILRLKQVKSRTGLSRSTIYNKMNQNSPGFDPTFPKQVSLGVGSVGWYESEIAVWILSRKCATH